MQIYNCGTSVTKPITMAGYRDMIIDSYRFFSFNKKTSNAVLRFHKNKNTYLMMKKLRIDIPIKVA